jgi:hypothetical protein
MLWAMSDARSSTASSSTVNKVILCAITLVAANLAFYFASDSYFASHRQIVNGVSLPVYDAAKSMHVRMTFVLYSGVVTAAALAAAMWPRAVGHIIPVLLGGIHLVGGVATFFYETPTALGATLVITGVLMPVLAWLSFRRTGPAARPAWSFLVALCCTFAVVGFFGAPKLRAALDIGLWTAMILPGLNAVAAFALISLRAEYIEREAVAA